jgi:hypothetical protein
MMLSLSLICSLTHTGKNAIFEGFLAVTGKAYIQFGAKDEPENSVIR